MYYKKYGNTEMKMSAVGLGTMRYDDGLISAGKLEACAEIPLYAFEKGINYFDTAPFYCQDKSEEITGMALSQLKRDQFYVSSKTNFNAIKALSGGEISRDAFRRRLETSLARLKLDYLDFYHLWCVLSLDAYETQCEALYRFFEEARSEGLIRNIVFSAHLQGRDVEEVIASGKFKGMLLGYNVLNYRFRQSGIEKAYEKGMGVVVMNPLSGGLIPQNPETFSFLTEGTDLNVAQAALRFVASHREVTVALAGCTTKEHIDDAVKAVKGLEELPAREVIAKYETQGLSFNDLCTGCGYCNSCPKGIEIPKFMDSYNQKLLTGREQEILDRLGGHWVIPAERAAECIACRKCEQLCTQHLPIAERLQEIAGLAK